MSTSRKMFHMKQKISHETKRASDAACSAKINVVVILLGALRPIAPNDAEKCGNRAYG